MTSSVRFDRGTLLLEGACSQIRGAVWDPDAGRQRAPAYIYELITRGTLDERLAAGRTKHVAD